MVSVGDCYPQRLLEPNSKDSQVLYKIWSSSVSVESVESGDLLCVLNITLKSQEIWTLYNIKYNLQRKTSLREQQKETSAQNPFPTYNY